MATAADPRTPHELPSQSTSQSSRDLPSDLPKDLGHDVVDALVQLSFTVVAVLSQLAASIDVSLTQLRLLGILRDREPRMAELATRLGLDRSTVSGLIDRAADRGLVERVADPRDGRASRVRLTQAGRALAAELTQRATAAIEPLVEHLSQADRVELTARIRTLLPD